MANYTMAASAFDRRTGVRGIRGARKLRAVETAYTLTGKDSSLSTTGSASYPGTLAATGTFYARTVVFEGTTVDYQVFVPGSVAATPPFGGIVTLHSSAERYPTAGGGPAWNAGGVLAQYIGWPNNTAPSVAANVAPFGVNRWPMLTIIPQISNAVSNVDGIYHSQGAIPLMIAATEAEWHCDPKRWGLSGQSAGAVQLFPLIWMMPTRFAWVQCMSGTPAKAFFRAQQLPGWAPTPDHTTDQETVDFIVPIMVANGITFRMYHGSDDPGNTALGTALSPSIAAYYAAAGISSTYTYTVDHPAAAASVGETFDHSETWFREMAYAAGWTGDLFLQAKP